jgi:hypothetical protein
MSLVERWMAFEVTTLSEKNQAQKEKYVFTHMKNLNLKFIIIWHDCKRGAVWVEELEHWRMEKVDNGEGEY